MPPGLPYVVIGSGPTGVACTQALLERGKEVLMLDAGAELEPARQEFVDSIAALPKEKWPAETVARLKERMAPTAAGVPLKYLFGSDFPYRRPAAAAILQRQYSLQHRCGARATTPRRTDSGVREDRLRWTTR